jgi:predicted metalloprotease
MPPSQPSARPRPAATATAPGTARTRSRRRLAGLALAAVVAVAGGLAWVHARPAPAPEGRAAAFGAAPTLAGAEAERLARRVAAVHADVGKLWTDDFRWRLGRSYTPAALVTFVGARPGLCAGAGARSGPHYCAAERTLAIDLGFAGRLEQQLRAEGARAVALVVARYGAEHVQAELAILGDAERRMRDLPAAERRRLERALLLQADCLTGLWARRAAAALGEVEPGAWARVLEGARLATPAAAEASGLDQAPAAEREAAFAAGHAAGSLRACLTPGLAGVLG